MVADAIPPLTSAERDAKSPVSEQIMEKIDLALEILQDLIVSNALGILAGAADSDPPNTTNSYVTDTNPTVGKIDRTDKFKDLYLKITSGAASGRIYKITATDATNKRVQVAENLYADGVRSGDGYKVIGHRHTGVDSEKVDFNDLLNNPQGATFEWEAGRSSVTIDGSRLGQVSFSSAFSEPPIVVASIETTDNSTVSFHTILAGDDPFNNFRILSASTGSPKVFHWFACTPGVWLVNGNLIIAGHLNVGVTTGNDRMRSIWFPRPFSRNPAALLNLNVDGFGNNQPGANAVHEVNYLPAGGRENATDADALNVAGRCGGAFFFADATTSNGVNFIFIAPTAALQISDGPTWGGSSTFKSGVKFEAGVFKRSSSGESGTITFNSAFASNPSTILGMSPSTGLAERWPFINSASDPGTSSVPYRTIGGVSTDGLVSFFSIVRGKDSVAASRLG